jgi:hypothetical protein
MARRTSRCGYGGHKNVTARVPNAPKQNPPSPKGVHHVPLSAQPDRSGRLPARGSLGSEGPPLEAPAGSVSFASGKPKDDATGVSDEVPGRSSIPNPNRVTKP